MIVKCFIRETNVYVNYIHNLKRLTHNKEGLELRTGY